MHKIGIIKVLAGLMIALAIFCSVAYADQGNSKALLRAASSGDLKQVEDLLEKGVDVNAKDWFGMTALLWASYKGQLDAVRLLLEKGSDVNVKGWMGSTALTEACNQGRAPIVELLKAHGAKE